MKHKDQSSRLGAEAQSIITLLRKLTKQTGHLPTKGQFEAHTSVSSDTIKRVFGGWIAAVTAAGLKPRKCGVHLTDAELLKDWGAIARKLGHAPTRVEYNRHGAHNEMTYWRRFGSWNKVRGAFERWAAAQTGWDDVIKLARDCPDGRFRRGTSDAHSRTKHAASESSAPRLPPHISRRLPDLPLLGAPMKFRNVGYEPISEQGVVLLFGMLAADLGYHIEKTQTGFPDCEAVRRVAGDAWQRVRIEFEYESRNFKVHGHDEAECDVIVCWRHNWPDCPARIDVVELSSAVRRMIDVGRCAAA